MMHGQKNIKFNKAVALAGNWHSNRQHQF